MRQTADFQLLCGSGLGWVEVRPSVLIELDIEAGSLVFIIFSAHKSD